MISILIPVYNWDIKNLAQILSDQLSDLNINSEVIFYDDCSTDLALTEINKNVVEKLDFNYVLSSQNRGIAEALNYLATLAKYDWLIYLDADVLPIKSDFLKNYIEQITDEIKVFCGGLYYSELQPKEGILRWKYGKKYEVQTVEKANENPYLNFKACNFLIHRMVIQEYPFVSNNGKEYAAIDTLFGLKLENTPIKIEFIENRVYHLGLETNEIYLKKVENYVKSISKSFQINPELDSVRLVRFYKHKHKILLKTYAYIFKYSKPLIIRNLLSNNSFLFLLQFYKLGLFIVELNKK